MTVRFRDFLEQQLQDEEFRAEYETLALEDSIMQAVIDARKAKGLTQEQLSERTGISWHYIKAMESGNA